jgi:2-hydroxycyclohexanecarboxyl-CoA dehydrogenase
MTQKVAFVTGAAAGIGAECCRRLAQDGIAVGVADINLADAQAVAAEINAAGGKALAVQANVADRTQVESAFAQLREAFGPVTIVVNNAGISAFTPFEEITDTDWDRMFEINLKGAFICIQTALPDMKAAAWGRVINISSSSAQSGTALMAHYSASKGGMISLTRSLALELGPLGITVNNVPPGAVMNTIMSEAMQEKFPIPPEQIRQTLPVRRTGEPSDIANAVAWLASEATSYVTGQTIGVNGGRVVS